jgi:predicted Zn-dependent peptidase
MSGILGGGMSSRLFQTLREERGLCYSVYAFTAAHQETGLFGVYLALNKRAQTEALRVMLSELRRFAAEGPTPDELTRAIEQNMAGVLMGLESTTARMSFLGRGELLIGEIPSYDEIVERYAAVTRQEVHDLAASILDFGQMSLSAAGDVSPARVYRDIMRM